MSIIFVSPQKLSTKLRHTETVKDKNAPKKISNIQKTTCVNFDMLFVVLIIYIKSRWWFQTFFIFTPTWGRFPFFSKGLKPPTSYIISFEARKTSPKNTPNHLDLRGGTRISTTKVEACGTAARGGGWVEEMLRDGRDGPRGHPQMVVKSQGIRPKCPDFRVSHIFTYMNGRFLW